MTMIKLGVNRMVIDSIPTGPCSGRTTILRRCWTRCCQYGGGKNSISVQQPTPQRGLFMKQRDFLLNSSPHFQKDQNGIKRRSYYTNGSTIKKNDPYAILGLQWGDGASSSQIRNAFRNKARELHPDVNQTDKPKIAIQKFQQLQKAYETLMKNFDTTNDGSYDIEEWRIAIWRQSDRIACDRTDVAGVARKRPIQPASTTTSKGSRIYSNTLGHPDGRGITSSRGGEYIEDGCVDDNGGKKKKKKNTSSVGNPGRNKWVKPKQFVPWNGGGDGSGGGAGSSSSSSSSSASDEK